MNFRIWLEEYANDAGEAFWGNVGAGILPISKQTGKILVALRSHAVNEPNTWGAWGGKVDDEHRKDLQGEARREFEEETGYSGHMDLYPAHVFHSQGGGFEYHNFIGTLDEEFEPKSNWETNDHKWVTWDELALLSPKHFGLKALLKNSGPMIKSFIQRERKAG